MEIIDSFLSNWLLRLGKNCAVSLSKRLLVCLIRLTLNTYNHQQSSSQSPTKEVTIAISFIFRRCFVLCCRGVEWNILIPRMTSRMCVACVLLRNVKWIRQKSSNSVGETYICLQWTASFCLQIICTNGYLSFIGSFSFLVFARVTSLWCLYSD